MSVNRYDRHVLVLPEDDANRQIANGFCLNPELDSQAIQILPSARGWKNAIKKFTDTYIPKMRQYPKSTLVILIDFDENENRLCEVENEIPDDLKERVFVLGVFSEPEELKSDVNKNFEKIGEALAKDCSDDRNTMWSHPLLQHNQPELDRTIASVKPFLFARAQ